MKLLLLIILLFIPQNCTLNKKISNHGVNNLELKQSKMIINVTNKNEILKNIGPPSSISTFNNNVYIYIEKKSSASKLSKLGKKELILNNVLLLELDNKGILISKKFYNKEDMKNIQFDKKITSNDISKKSFTDQFLFSIIKQIDDPLGKKRSKN